jgi:hypothetical protein
MVYDLFRILDRVAPQVDASTKTEIEFDVNGEDLWISISGHKPDGTYTDAESYKFVLEAEKPAKASKK